MQGWPVKIGYIARAQVIVVAACFLMPAEAKARGGWIHLAPLSWEVELEYKALRGEKNGFDIPQIDLYTEKVEFLQSGYVINPKIVNFSVAFAPTFSQQKLGNGADAAGTVFDYDINLHVLAGAVSPVYFEADAARYTGTFSSNLGTRTDSARENRSVNARWKLTALPMRLSYREDLSEQTIRTRSGSTPRYRNEFQRSIQWQAQNSKLNMKVEKRWFDDRVTDNDYESLQESVTHVLRWGKGSRLRTRHEYHRREGSRSFTRQTFSQAASLQHWVNLRSDIDYNFNSMTLDEVTKTRDGSYRLTYQSTENSNAILTARGREREFATGSEKFYGGGLGLTYRRDVFLNGRLKLGFDGSSMQTDRQSNGTTYETLDVSYTVPATLLVLLNTRAIDTGSVFITDLAASQVFLEGVDYIIRALSGDRTELQILTTGLIGAGDTILISYSAAAQPSAEFNTGSVRVDISLDFNWLNFYHSSRFTEETLQSGSFGVGQNDLRDQTTGAELKWSKAWFGTSWRAEARSYESGEFSTESVLFTETAKADLPSRIKLVLSASQISSVSDGRKTDLSQWDVNLSGKPLSGMLVKPYVGSWKRREDFGQDEERLAAGVNFSWRLRAFKLDLDLSHQEHVIGEFDRTEQRLDVRIIRRSQ